MTIEIDNLTDAQKMAIEDMLAQWQALGGIGGSRWTAFFADGDGNFRPKITVDGRKAQSCELGNPKKRWKTLWHEDKYGMHPVDLYMIDFDEIAWALHGEESESKNQKERNDKEDKEDR